MCVAEREARSVGKGDELSPRPLGVDTVDLEAPGERGAVAQRADGASRVADHLLEETDRVEFVVGGKSQKREMPMEMTGERARLLPGRQPVAQPRGAGIDVG